MASLFDKPYNSEERLIIALDIGTTHSAVSFVHAYPGSQIDIRMVTRWPGQSEAAGDSKIPTMIAYKGGEAKAYGINAEEYIADDDYEVARWFKLHLHPESMKISDQSPHNTDPSSVSLPTIEVPPLPNGVSLSRIYAQFMAYLFSSTKAFFENTTPNGRSIWSRLDNDMVIVIATPNGWDVSQHVFLKHAAIKAGIVRSQQDAEDRLEFVTEGEASVHYALAKTNMRTWMRKGSIFCVCDCGGSTVDSTLYECKQLLPKLTLEEVCASECVQAGGVFVDRAARQMLTIKLRNSNYGDEESLNDMELAFERKTKRLFDGTNESYVIDFGGRQDNDREFGILKGKLTLSREEVASAFNDVLRQITDSCLRLRKDRKIRHLLLVGGFGESPYLQTCLRETFGKQGTEVVTVEDSSKKAAAEGAVIWYLKQLVTARVARYTIGTEYSPDYDADNPEHYERRAGVYLDALGLLAIPDGFRSIIVKNSRISKTKVVVTPFLRVYGSKPGPKELKTKQPLFLWDADELTRWTRNVDGSRPAGLRRLCEINADFSPILGHLQPRRSKDGTKVWAIDLEIVVAFDGRRLRAWLRWEENGATREGPVTILPGEVLK